MKSIHIILVTFLLICTIKTEVWESKLKKRQYKVKALNKTQEAATQETNQQSKPICQDEIKNCRKLRDRKLCEMKLIQMNCRSTCGLCAPSPPLDCSLTKYGCCWDNYTKANSSNKGGCPPCIDKFNECKYFKHECGTRQDIRLLCPITCGIKCDQCRDSEHQALLCPSYKKFNFCEISPDLMRQICARTCDFCPIGSI